MHEETGNRLGEFCEMVVELAPTSQAYGSGERTMVGIDESVSHPSIHQALTRVKASGRQILEMPLWQELRRQDTGEVIAFSGYALKGINHNFDLGRRVEADSWPDTRVVQLAITYLMSNRRVVLLSADRKGKLDGLRTLLHLQIKPVLNRDLTHGLSLILLLQRPRTRIEGYAHRVETFLRHDQSLVLGFKEEWL